MGVACFGKTNKEQTARDQQTTHQTNNTGVADFVSNEQTNVI
jgi:hypothetical protein